jgi:hypothetical protein
VSTAVIVYILTALAALVVILTRVRLAGENDGAGNYRVGRGLVNVHTVAGVLALAIWVTFLATQQDTFSGDSVRSLIGVVALFFWWVTAIIGLLVLLRWLPTRGKHAGARAQDSWSEGPGLSLLAHIGLLLGVCVFTAAYLTSAV